MATTEEVANRALQLARAFVDAHRGELAHLAGSGRDVLIDAQQLLTRADQSLSEPERAPYHVAFALLAAAYYQTLHDQ